MFLKGDVIIEISKDKRTLDGDFNVNEMNHTCTLVTYILVLVLSLVLYFAEIGCHAAAAWKLFQENQHVWLSLHIGLLVVPVVTAQCLSIYQSWDTFHWVCARILWGLAHVLLLAMPSRYIRLLLCCGTVDVQKELAQTLQLRSFLGLSNTLPLALLEVYIVFTDTLPSESNKIIIAAASVALFSAACTLSTFRKRDKDFRYLETIISWPGIVFKLIWKLGELGSRILVLALFTQLYTLWIFMVLVGHWICMLLSLLLETKLKSNNTFTSKSALRILATSYTYVFCYMNVTTKPEKYRFVVFYLIMSVENALLLLLWLLYDVRKELHLAVAVATGVMFGVSLISALFYYNCFHVKSSDKQPLSNETNYIQQCINCKLSFCVKHDKRFQRPFDTDWWVEVRAASSDQDSTDYLYPSEYMINSKGLTPGVKTAVLVPVQDLSDEGKGQIRYFKYYRDAMDNTSANSISGSFVIPYREPTGESVSDTYSWDDYDLQQNGLDDPENPNQHPGHVGGIEEVPSTDTGTQPRDSNKPSDSGFSASTSSRSGSRLSPFSQGEYVLYISDNDDSDISTSFVSTERGIRPIRYYLSDQWSVTTSTTDTLDHSGRPPRRLLYRLPGGLAKLQETKGNKGRDNKAFLPDVQPDPEDGRVVLFPVRMCSNCGSSSTDSPAIERREPKPPARKPMSERMLAERRRARKQRMANAKMISRSRQHFKSQMAQLRRKMESSGLSDGDCSVVGVVLSSCPSELNSSNERLAIDKKSRSNAKHIHDNSAQTRHHKSSKTSKKKKETSKANETKPRKKPWELTPENTIQFKERPKKKPRDLSPAGFEVKFDGSKPFTIETEAPSTEIMNATITI